MAFAGCVKLTSIIIPSSVTSIESMAFVGCVKLTIYAEAASRPSGWVFGWNIDSTDDIPVYYYSEISESGKWHYVNNVPTVW
jgi:hypothetical protein